ncbi:hypothetical protein MIND_00892400 [Mycena indigotica]|uniref:Uncharacterized protein n=1 Tax=Mycena indigotica TaxID=2126181 RepID=A0A8H6SIU0_9AGAR|nr:uncharacterized protein MIND_00892400 [Mycena indigotica]KAF7299426.1 hypothetical protein MIND_00892400 [Mycena indigotica]
MGAQYRADLAELADSDLNTRGEKDSDSASRLQLGRVGESWRARNEPSASASGAVSWIWKTVVGEGEETRLHEAVRVRWTKTLARRDRWIEEVRLLREEMKRVLRSLRAVQQTWQERVECGRAVVPEVATGLKAYARKQVALHQWIAECFVAEWTKPGKAAVETVLRLDLGTYEQLLVRDSEELGLRSVEESISVDTRTIAE